MVRFLAPGPPLACISEKACSGADIQGLHIERHEEWLRDSRVLRVRLAFEHSLDLENKEPLENLRFLFAYESDPENYGDEGREDRSANDVQDLDGDGAPDWVESAGIMHGWSTGNWACDPARVELGHYAEWGGVNDADEPLLDGGWC